MARHTPKLFSMETVRPHILTNFCRHLISKFFDRLEQAETDNSLIFGFLESVAPHIALIRLLPICKETPLSIVMGCLLRGVTNPKKMR